MRVLTRLRIAVLACATLLAASVVVSADTVESAWVDPERATATVTSVSLAPPTKSGECSIDAQLLGNNAIFTWANASPAGPITRTGYLVTVAIGTAAPVRTQTLGANTLTATINTSLLTPLAASTTYDVRIQATSTTPAWQSAAIRGTITTNSSGWVISCSYLTVP